MHLSRKNETKIVKVTHSAYATSLARVTFVEDRRALNFQSVCLLLVKLVCAVAGRRFGFEEGFNEEIFSSPEELNVSFS